MFVYAFLLVILICTACFYSIDIQFLKQLKLTTKSKKNSYSQQRVFKKQIISGPIITGIWPYGPNNQIQSALELLTIAKYFNATSYISPFYPHWTHDNSKNVTIDPKLTLNLKAISHYQDLISLNEFKANCGDSKKTLTVIKTHVSVDIPSNIQRIHDFERVIGITDLINLIDYKNIDTLFDENSETLADTCIIIVFPFNLIPTEHECDHFKSKSKRRKTCDIEPKMSVNQGKNNNNPFRIHPCSECRQFSELVTKLSKEFKEKTIFSVTTETPRFHVGIHWRYDKHDYCNVFNNGHTKLSDVSSFKRKKYKICERIQNVDKFELAARLCDYYTRGRFEKRNANFGYLYFATADKRLAYEIKDVFDESGCDLMLVGRTELDGFLQKHGAVQGFEECVYEEVLSMVEQELIASSRMLMLSQESTFSKRIASVSQTNKMFDVLSL